jgi:hypothetical protein
MNKQRLQTLAGLLSESKKRLNESHLGDFILPLGKRLSQDSMLSDEAISTKQRELIDRFHKEYSDKLNRKFAKDLKEMVGKTFESGVPSYLKNIPVKSAKFDIRPYFDGETETVLKITFEGGKTIEKDVQRYYSQPGVF